MHIWFILVYKMVKQSDGYGRNGIRQSRCWCIRRGHPPLPKGLLRLECKSRHIVSVL